MAGIFRDKIKLRKGLLTIQLRLLGYEEDGGFIFFSPALDLCSFGETQEEALQAFNESIALYMDHVLEEGTLEADLTKQGWKKSSYHKRFTPPKYDPFKIMDTRGISSFNVNVHNQELALA